MNQIIRVSYIVLSLVIPIHWSVNVNARNVTACTTPVNELGKCITLRNCTSLFKRILKGKNLTPDDRIHLSRSQCGYDDGQPLVCCPDIHSTLADNRLPHGDECGINPMHRIIRGIKADLDTFPWMALLEYSKPNNIRAVHCVGVLISKRYVLTIARCLNGNDIPSTWNLTDIRLGDYDLLTDPDCIDSDKARDCSELVITVPISQRIIHELYDPKSKSPVHDIALLRLKDEIIYSDFVRSICLSRSNFDYDNMVLTDAGWNRETNKYSVKLTGYIDMINNNHCIKVYNSEGVSIQDTQLCGITRPLVYTYKSCQGLSGSPLMQVNTNSNYGHWHLIGIESFGPLTCGETGKPNVYTRISSYIDWIESKIYI